MSLGGGGAPRGLYPRLARFDGRARDVRGPLALGEDPPNEIAFGAIGRFWSGETEWETISSGEFETFQRRGYARIGCNFSLRPYGGSHTLVSYECRTQATDDVARRGFLRYWRPLSPFIGVVLRSQLHVIAGEAA